MNRSFRLAAAAFALLHLLVVGLGPVADARLEASEQQFTAHYESERSQACAPGHDHFFCQICRVIGVAGGSAAPLGILCGQEAPAQIAPSAEAPDVLRHTLAAHGPRAPPAA